ncbi:unnamed protein product [Brachionus calyciflorus]|uniref:DAGKc domain-containing protein n=1 Tax=Brachionus calyciflorus TaxID=104777 RepID=A0A813WTE8_9BILA|nr:unnamed protein product [Brachionus calyciflorus]
MMKIFRTVRNNWKKSLFGFSVVTYGTYYLLDRKYRANLLQAYCYEALKYGKERMDPNKNLRRITIFLNPISGKERGKFLYDKHVAPLLHLSGLDVRMIRLEKNSEANEYMKEIDLNETDCIVVAGGNATLNEVISGLIHREDSSEFLKRIPIGIIPLGEHNNFAHKWLNSIGFKRASASELRLLADSAMAIIKGDTAPADLLKVSLYQNIPYDEKTDEHHDDKQRGAYSLLKENKIYALSKVAFGFVTLTDANLETFWYFSWSKWLQNRMNRYFMDRYLRRDPIKYELIYKNKCFGCSNCLNQDEIRKNLELLTNPPKEKSPSLVHSLFKKIVPPVKKESEDALLKKQKEIYKLTNLLEKSQNLNPDCNKNLTCEMNQVQVISNINQPDFEDPDFFEQASCIDTVIVKDPELNAKDMFLAQRKDLTEFEIKKIYKKSATLNSFHHKFSVEIDGEIYKLNNNPENDLHMKVEHLEKCINLIKYDPSSSKIEANYWPNIYLISQKTFEDNFNLNESQKSKLRDMPPILPFEKFYLKFWKP